MYYIEDKFTTDKKKEIKNAVDNMSTEEKDEWIWYLYAVQLGLCNGYYMGNKFDKVIIGNQNEYGELRWWVPKGCKNKIEALEMHNKILKDKISRIEKIVKESE